MNPSASFVLGDTVDLHLSAERARSLCEFQSRQSTPRGASLLQVSVYRRAVSVGLSSAHRRDANRRRGHSTRMTFREKN